VVLELSSSDERSTVQAEFERAAKTFAERTAGRFDEMDVARFSRVGPGATVVEVGAGTGNFLSLFDDGTRRLIAVDVTPAMLHEARSLFPSMELVIADGAALPFPARSIDLVASAQTLHHIREPVPVLMQMRRVVTDEGRVLIVDQVATEKVEEMMMMNKLDSLRDPSHAGCRPPSALRIMVQAAGLEIDAEEIHESVERFSTWMSHHEFPEERIAEVERFLAEHGHATGMRFEKDSDDWIYTRQRMMILARRVR
jgi:ubiquinone/menaquinone biosynthesis C-methylase UbiE